MVNPYVVDVSVNVFTTGMMEIVVNECDNTIILNEDDFSNILRNESFNELPKRYKKVITGIINVKSHIKSTSKMLFPHIFESNGDENGVWLCEIFMKNIPINICRNCIENDVDAILDQLEDDKYFGEIDESMGKMSNIERTNVFYMI